MQSLVKLLPRFSNYKGSALVLIAANTVLLGSVFFWGLDVFAVVGSYWIRNRHHWRDHRLEDDRRLPQRGRT